MYTNIEKMNPIYISQTNHKLLNVSNIYKARSMYHTSFLKGADQKSDDYMNNNIPVYDKGNKAGQSRFSTPTIKIL